MLTKTKSTQKKATLRKPSRRSARETRLEMPIGSSSELQAPARTKEPPGSVWQELYRMSLIYAENWMQVQQANVQVGVEVLEWMAAAYDKMLPLSRIDKSS